MKFSLIAAVVVLALAQGSFAEDAADLEKITQYFEDFKTRMTSELTAIMNNQDLASQAENLKAQLQPLNDKMREAVAKIGEHVKPLAENLQAQAQPVMENFQKQVEDIIQRATEHAKSLTN